MQTHGTNSDGQALCGQANGKLDASPKKVTCKRCLKEVPSTTVNRSAAWQPATNATTNEIVLDSPT